MPAVPSIARALILALFALGSRNADAATEQPLSADGLLQEGSIAFDAVGVPRIQAGNEFDAAFLLGYVHARDRLFQMDLNRRAARGSVAELLGPAALANDVQTRTLGLDRAARETWRELSPDTRGWLRSYALGVNAWIRRNDPPREYSALELTRVEPWSPLDSVAVMKLLSFQISFSLDIDFTLRLAAYQKAGAERGFDGTALFFEDTHRSQPADDRLTFPELRAPVGKARPAPGAAGSSIHFAEPTLALARAYRERIAGHPLIAPALESVNGRGGSNWWIIGGEHTVSGKPILAADPHLPLGIPNTFYEAHIRGGERLDVRGLGMPGIPALAYGCTVRVCWGLTTNHMDVTDVYEETLVLNGLGLPVATVFEGREEPVEHIVQSFRVNRLDGVADNVEIDPGIGYANGGLTVVVPRRNRGPLVQIAGNKGLSVQYAGWGPTFELEALRRMNRARDIDEMREAATFVDFGSVTVGYADVDGNIAAFAAGEQPLRDDLQNLERADGAPPFLIRDGSGSRRHEWLPATRRQANQALPYQILDADEMPFAVNPARGYLANGNNDPIGNTLDNNVLNDRRSGGGLLYLSPAYSTFRMGRIDRLIRARLDAGERIDFETSRAWQSDTRQLDAELLLPHLLRSAENALAPQAWQPLARMMDDPRLREAIQRLQAWDHSTPTGIAEGYDAGDTAVGTQDPTAQEIAHSVAASLYAGWRARTVRAVIDDTLARAGVVASPAGAGSVSGSRELLGALKFHLDAFPTRRGIGVSGVDFFAVPDAPTREAARDYVLLEALATTLDAYASPEFAPAFGGSRALGDYRWGRLHRIVLRHALRGPFDVPSAQALHGFRHLAPDLPGLARDGGYETINDGEHDIRAPGPNGTMFNNGAIYRMVAEMHPRIRAEQSFPGGQSADVGSVHYVDQYAAWLTQRYRPMHTGPSAEPAQASLRFVPRPSPDARN